MASVVEGSVSEPATTARTFSTVTPLTSRRKLSLSETNGMSLPGHFFGRADEVKLFRGMLRDYSDGRRDHGHVLVTAVSGLGKSTLLEAFAVMASAPSSGVSVYRSACSHVEGQAWNLWRTPWLLRAAQDHWEDLPDRYRPHRALLSDILPESASDGSPYGHATEPSRVAASLAGETRLRFIIAMVTALLHAAWRAEHDAHGTRPVLILDDVHAADYLSLKLLGHLRAETPHLFVVGSMRPLLSAPPTAGEGRRVSQMLRAILEDVSSVHITLGALHGDAAGDLLLHALHATDCPAALRQLVEDRAGGNPFFIKELVALLITSGYLAQGGDGGADGWVVTRDLADISGLVMGREHDLTLEAIVSSRVAAASDYGCVALAAAAVIGGRFDAHMLHEVCAAGELAGADMDDIAAELVTDGFWLPLDGVSFAFAHGLVRQTVYDAMPPEVVESMHAGMVTFLEDLQATARSGRHVPRAYAPGEVAPGGGHAEQQAGAPHGPESSQPWRREDAGRGRYAELAHHAEAARMALKAARYRLICARWAVRSGVPREAISAASRGLPLVDGAECEAVKQGEEGEECKLVCLHLLRTLGEAHCLVEEHGLGRPLLERALALAGRAVPGTSGPVDAETLDLKVQREEVRQELHRLWAGFPGAKLGFAALVGHVASDWVTGGAPTTGWVTTEATASARGMALLSASVGLASFGPRSTRGGGAATPLRIARVATVPPSASGRDVSAVASETMMSSSTGDDGNDGDGQGGLSPKTSVDRSGRFVGGHPATNPRRGSSSGADNLQRSGHGSGGRPHAPVAATELKTVMAAALRSTRSLAYGGGVAPVGASSSSGLLSLRTEDAGEDRPRLSRAVSTDGASVGQALSRASEGSHAGDGPIPAAEVFGITASSGPRGVSMRSMGGVSSTGSWDVKDPGGDNRLARPGRRPSITDGYWPMGSAASRSVASECIQALDRLARIYLQSGEPRLGVFAAFAGLNLAEQVGPSDELAQSYATMAFLKKSGAYAALAATVAASPVCGAQVEAYVAMVSGGMLIGEGRFEESSAALSRAAALSLELGDARNYALALNVTGWMEYIEGSYTASVATAQRLMAHGMSTADDRAVAWGTTDLVRSLLACGELTAARSHLPAMVAAYELSASSGGLASNAVYHCGLCVELALLEGDVDTLAREVDRAAPLIAKPLTQLVEYSGLASITGGLLALHEVACASVGDGPPPPPPPALVAALSTLVSYSLTYPIALPRALTLRGRLEWASGRHASAVDRWRDAVRASTVESGGLALPAECARALWELRRTTHGPAALAKSASLFGSCGAHHLACVARRALGKGIDGVGDFAEAAAVGARQLVVSRRDGLDSPTPGLESPPPDGVKWGDSGGSSYRVSTSDGVGGTARGSLSLRSELMHRLMCAARTNLRVAVGADASALAASLRRTAFEFAKLAADPEFDLLADCLEDNAVEIMACLNTEAAAAGGNGGGADEGGGAGTRADGAVQLIAIATDMAREESCAYNLPYVADAAARAAHEASKPVVPAAVAVVCVAILNVLIDERTARRPAPEYAFGSET